MERRRKALGLRKRNERIEDDNQNRPSGKYDKKPKIVKKGKDTQSKSVLTSQSTPKRHNEVSTPMESPSSPLQSPGLQPIFPRTLGSPEIEVSWDWGCSQVLKDVAPTRQLKRTNQQQLPSPLVKDELSSFTHCPRLLHRQMSEQENQERLAFYKNVLSQSSKGDLKLSDDSKSNNMSEESCHVSMKETITPKRAPKVEVNKNDEVNAFFDDKSNNMSEESCHVSMKETITPKRAPKVEVNKNDEVNAFFDDSANEFMLECSQAIEEQLKNGQITAAPVVYVQGQKHAHSPVVDEGNSLKRMCHVKTKLNLFPDVKVPTFDESPKSDRRKLSLRSPRNKLTKINVTPDKLIVASQSTLKENEDADSNDDMLFLKPTQSNCALNYKKKICITNDKKCSVPSLKDDESILKSFNLTNSVTHVKNNINNNQYLLDEKILSAPVSNSVTLQNSAHHSKPIITKQQTINNNLIQSSNNFSSGQVNGKTDNIIRPPVHYDSVDKFRRVPKGNTTINNNQVSTNSNQVSTNSNMGARPVVNNSISQVNQNRTKSCFEMNQRHLDNSANVPVSKVKDTDVACLLDDDFDVELSSLDFESLVCNSQIQEVPDKPKPVTQTAPKICTQQEIEAKRIAALNRLRLKKRM